MNSENNPVADPKTKKSTKAKLGNKFWYIIGGAVALIAAIVVVVVVLILNRPQEDEIIVVNGQTLSEEERRITKQTIDEYINMEVKGYQTIGEGENAYGAVVIDITNSGNDRTSLAIDVIARDAGDGTVLDTSSMYAEGIEPGMTYTFYTFVYSELTADQLKNAKYEIYKANTYKAVTDEEETPAEETEEETPAEETKEETSTETEAPAEETKEETPTETEAPAETETTESTEGENQEENQQNNENNQN